MKKKFLVAALVICFALCICACGKNDNKPAGGETNNSQSENQSETQNDTQAGTEGGSSEVINTEDETEKNTETEVTESESESQTESEKESESQKPSTSETPSSSQKPSSSETPSSSQKPSSSETPSSSQKPSSSETPSTSETPDSSEPESEVEILGKGSQADPYEIIPDVDTASNTMTVTTESVPAGKTLYYKIQRIGGMNLTLNDSNAYIIESDGTRHNASGGKVSFQVENGMASEYILLQIGNSGSSAKSFTLKFTNAEGSQMNPTKLSTTGTYSVHVEEGNATGHYYKYNAQQTGTLRFYINSASVDSGITVTNNRNSAQRNFDGDVKTDEAGKSYIELEVNAGDEIIIQVHAIPTKRFKYPATDVTWEMKY